MGIAIVLCQKGSQQHKWGTNKALPYRAACLCTNRAQKALKASKEIKHPDIFWASKPVTNSLHCKSEGNGRGHWGSITQITMVETSFTLFLHFFPHENGSGHRWIQIISSEPTTGSFCSPSSVIPTLLCLTGEHASYHEHHRGPLRHPD